MTRAAAGGLLKYKRRRDFASGERRGMGKGERGKVGRPHADQCPPSHFQFRHVTVNSLLSHARLSEELLDRARRLDRHYIPTRYPNGFDRGAPRDYFTAADSNQAISDAEAILGFCAGHVS